MYCLNTHNKTKPYNSFVKTWVNFPKHFQTCHVSVNDDLIIKHIFLFYCIWKIADTNVQSTAKCTSSMTYISSEIGTSPYEQAETYKGQQFIHLSCLISLYFMKILRNSYERSYQIRGVINGKTFDILPKMFMEYHIQA